MKPNINERINRANAATEERKSQEHQRIHAMIEARREVEDFAAWKTWMRFEMDLMAFSLLRKLEEQRDTYAPTHPDDDWSEEFCEAVRMLPEVRRFAEDCWYDIV